MVNKTKPNLRKAGLPIHPVLIQGYIVFAHAHYSGKRTVTLENPSADEIEPSNQGTNKSHFGTGSDIHSAFNQALRSYHQTSPNYQALYTAQERTYNRKRAINKLDKWLAKHSGKLRAVCDFDGTILVHLTGLSDPANKLSTSIVLQGGGKSFYEALESAFSGSFKYNNYDAEVRQVEIKTVAVKPVKKVASSTRNRLRTTPKIKLQKRQHLSYSA